MQNTQKHNLLFWLLPTPGNIIFTLLFISSVLYAQSAGAIPLTMTNAPTATNVLIPYQGRLADPDGNLLSGPQVMTFALYNVETGGQPVWTEHRIGNTNSVPVTDGLFNVMLGEVTSLNQTIITNNSALYLGITIGSNSEVSPRVQLGYVPYAVTVSDGSITTAKLADGAVTQRKLATHAQIIDCFPSSFAFDRATSGSWSADLFSCNFTAPTDGIMFLSLQGHQRTSSGGNNCYLSFGVPVSLGT